MLTEREANRLEGARLGCPPGWEQLVLGESSCRRRKVLLLRREGPETAWDSLCKWDSKSRQTLNPPALTPSKPLPQPFLIPNGDFHLSTELPKDVGSAARLSFTGRW